MKVDPDKKVMVVTDPDGKTVTMKLDPNRNTLVVTDDKGKTATLSADNNGLQVNSSDGSFKMGTGADKAPDWVPVYPGVTPQSTFSANSATEQSGSYAFQTSDSVDKVMSYYGDQLKSAGFNVSNMTSNANGKSGGTVSGTSEGDKRTVVVILGSDDSGTKVSVTFTSKKQN